MSLRVEKQILEPIPGINPRPFNCICIQPEAINMINLLPQLINENHYIFLNLNRSQQACFEREYFQFSLEQRQASTFRKKP